MHSYINSFIPIFIHSYIHSFLYSSIHSFLCSFIHSSIYSCMHTYINHPFIHTVMHSFHSYSFIHSFIYPSISTHPSMHSLIYLVVWLNSNRVHWVMTGMNVPPMVCWVFLCKLNDPSTQQPSQTCIIPPRLHCFRPWTKVCISACIVLDVIQTNAYHTI